MMKKFCYHRIIELLMYLLTTENILHAGTDFAAIDIPQSMHNIFMSMQQYISNRLGKEFTLSPTSPQNLHITLKEIADLNNKERKLVKSALEKVARQIRPSNISESLQYGSLKIHSNGLAILKLKSNKWLTQLAEIINTELKKLKDQGSLRHLKKRMDFPSSGHITLGYIKYKSKAPIAKFNKIQKNFKNYYSGPFIVDHFVLLKSNRPSTPRIYANKGMFYLKTTEPIKVIITGRKDSLTSLTQTLSNLSFRQQSNSSNFRYKP